MTDKYSITEARRDLPKLVRMAGQGMTVGLTRRGRPVAMLIGCKRFERLASSRRSFVTAYQVFTNESDITELALDPDKLFTRQPEKTPGRGSRCER